MEFCSGFEWMVKGSNPSSHAKRKRFFGSFFVQLWFSVIQFRSEWRIMLQRNSFVVGNTKRQYSETEDYLRKKETARKQRESYIPAAIEKVKKLLSEERIMTYMGMFPYETAMRRAERYLHLHGIRDNNLIFTECYSDAGLVYMYVAYRCAYCSYSHFWNYFYFMMRIVIIWNYYLCDEAGAICMTNNLKRVYLDSETVNL